MEFRVIHDIMHFRTTPDGDWVEMNKMALTSMITSLQEDVEEIRTQSLAATAALSTISALAKANV